jgi:hypothetical protein
VQVESEAPDVHRKLLWQYIASTRLDPSAHTKEPMMISCNMSDPNTSQAYYISKLASQRLVPFLLSRQQKIISLPPSLPGLCSLAEATHTRAVVRCFIRLCSFMHGPEESRRVSPVLPF